MKKIFFTFILLFLFASCSKNKIIEDTTSTSSGVIVSSGSVSASGSTSSSGSLVFPKEVQEQKMEKTTDNSGSNSTKDTSVKQDVDEMDKDVQELTDKLFNDLSNMVEDEK